MKINQIISETTTAGAVAPVSQSFVKMSTRNPVVNSKKGNNLLTGKVTNKKYANSVNEGKMKDLAMDLKSGPDGLTDEEFKKKYGKTKQEMRKAMKEKPEPTKVEEAKLDEDDIIVLPGHKGKRKTGFVKHGESRVDHEVEMARSDILATIKNAKALYKLLQHRSEEEGLEGWVQEKLIKANDYLNAVKEYYDEKSVQQEGVTENNQRGDTLVTDALKLMRGSEVSDAVKALTTVLGNREYNSRRGFYNFYIKQMIDMYNKKGVAEGAKVDRMVKHIAKSERKLGKSKDEAENIAWATANKRGYLDNKNKKAK